MGLKMVSPASHESCDQAWQDSHHRPALFERPCDPNSCPRMSDVGLRRRCTYAVTPKDGNTDYRLGGRCGEPGTRDKTYRHFCSSFLFPPVPPDPRQLGGKRQNARCFRVSKMCPMMRDCCLLWLFFLFCYDTESIT